MTAVASYGAVSGTLDNDPLQIEVVKSLYQRPIEVRASWIPEIGAAVGGFENTAGRLVVYRGRVTAIQLFNLEPYSVLSLGDDVRIFVDEFVKYGQNTMIDFRDWPNDIVRTEPNEPLGAMLIRPHNMTGLGADVLAIGSLVFIGAEYPVEPDDDVRKVKIK